MAGEEAGPVAAPEPGDRRFTDDAWTENPIYDHIRQSYLLASKFMLSTVRETEGLDAHTAQKVDFYTRQFIDALAPTNFAMTNPEVVRRTVETGGENLVQGLENMLEDLERGQGRLRIRMTDLEKFRLGENVAVTPGKVVFENDLMQLIQYAPATEAVRRRPLLIIPPWINKFYILDLRPKNSFIKWAVDRGRTVFVISWVNPDERLAEKSMDDYMLEGPIAALDAIGQATGEPRVNAIGYCLGGTLLAATLAYLKVADAPVAAKAGAAIGAPAGAVEGAEAAKAGEVAETGDAEPGTPPGNAVEDTGDAGNTGMRGTPGMHGVQRTYRSRRPSHGLPSGVPSSNPRRSSPPWSTSSSPASSGCSSTRSSSRWWRSRCRRRATSTAPAWRRRSTCCAPTTLSGAS